MRCTGISKKVGVSVVVLTIFSVIFPIAYSDSSHVLVETPVGLIKGAVSPDSTYHMFFGIPYGNLNKTNLFGAPIPYSKFDVIFEANDDSIICPQISNNSPVGVPECLQLNIFTPTTANINNRLPVMVWIHGGSFSGGSKSYSSYGPKYLVRHDIILVTVNYRLGPYGFMCLDIPEVPGNQGLKDQTLALRWLRENIEAFGGDVNKINIFGLSAGGHSIDFHILSDNEILFNNAILQSGSAVASTVFTEHDKRAPIKIAEKLGYKTDSMHEAIAYISSVNSNNVIQASDELSLIYKPCKEQTFENVEPFLTKHWVNANPVKAKDMPILIGFCEHEVLLRYADPKSFNNLTVIRDRLTETFNFDENRLEEMEALINEFYFGDKEMTYELLFPVTNFDSDFTYIHPIRRSIKKFIKNEAKDVFYYMFSYNGTRNKAKHINNFSIGSAVHGDEMGYLFDSDILSDDPNPEDQLVIDRLTTMWTNFAKYSNPTPVTSDLITVQWTPLSNESYEYLKIDSIWSLLHGPVQERMEFWDKFYVDNEMFQKGFSED